MIAWGTVIGAAGGFLASIAPDVMNIVREHFAHSRDMEARDQEITAAQAGVEVTKPEEDPTDIAPLADSDGDGDGCSWLMYFKSSVRPTVTYAFFLLFAYVKLASLYHAYHVEHLPAAQALPVLWDDETETLFSAVISFWFGSRARSKHNSGDATETRKTIRPTNDVTGSRVIVGE